MSSAMNTPPPKSQRTKHQQARNAVPSATEATNTHASSAQRRQRNNRNNYSQNQQLPAWQDEEPSQYPTGDFDATGNFIQKQPASRLRDADEGTVSDDVPASTRPRKGRQRQNVRGGSTSSAAVPAVDGASSPSRGPRKPTPSVPVKPQAPSATPVKNAYAGAAFHASPAPSSIPLPKFLSKSMPAANSEPTLQTRLDNESDKSGSSSPPEPEPAVAVPPRNEESPLDFFFKADREEKEAKRRSASGVVTPKDKPNLVPVQSEPPRVNNWSSIYGAGERRHSRHASNNSGKGVFMMELDGVNSGGPAQPGPPSPGLAPPQRMSVSRSVSASSAIPQAVTPPTQDRDAHSESLRKFLFSLPSSDGPLASPQPQSRASLVPAMNNQAPSPFFRPNHTPPPRSTSGPSTPVPQHKDNHGPPLHYGNRNLSPLFMAAKTDSVKRASSLRQEITSPSPDTANSQARDTQSGLLTETPSRRPAHKTDPPTQVDPPTFPRGFLDAHLQGARSHSSPDLPLQGRAASQRGHHYHPQPVHNSNLEPTASAPAARTSGHTTDGVSPGFPGISSSSVGPDPAAQSRSSGSASGPRDIKSMEDDLRRMLKISAGV